MANGDVHFVLTGDEAKAFSAFQRIVDQQSKMERGAGRVNRKLQEQSKAASQVGKQFAAAGAAVAGVAGAAFAQQVDAQTKAMVRFSDELQQLAGLEDNIEKIGELREQVNSLSVQWGLSQAAIADAMFNIQSGAASLDKSLQQEVLHNAIMATKVYGVDLPSSVNATTKAFLIFEKEGRSVEEVQQRLALTAERGALRFSELASQYPDLAAAAQVAKVSQDELNASIIVATQRLGRTERTFTGLRGVMLKMQEAEKKGIELNGTFIEQLEQLGQLSAKERLDLFGQESIGAAETLIANLEQVNDELINMEKRLPDIDKKLATKLTDVAESRVERLRQAQQRLAVVDSGGGDGPFAGTGVRLAETRADLAESLGFDAVGSLEGVGVGSVNAGNLLNYMALGARELDSRTGVRVDDAIMNPTRSVSEAYGRTQGPQLEPKAAEQLERMVQANKALSDAVNNRKKRTAHGQ